MRGSGGHTRSQQSLNLKPEKEVSKIQIRRMQVDFLIPAVQAASIGSPLSDK